MGEPKGICNCGNENIIVTLNQDSFCRECAEDKRSELEEDLEIIENKIEALKEEREKLFSKYDIGSYQEGPRKDKDDEVDIPDSDLGRLSELADDWVARREAQEDIRYRLEQLNSIL